MKLSQFKFKLPINYLRKIVLPETGFYSVQLVEYISERKQISFLYALELE